MDELSTELSRLGRLMDAAALRTRVIAENLANVNTPGYTRSRVVFEDALGAALRRGNTEAADRIRPRVTVDPGGEVKPDGNNVHMETEVTEMVKAATLYNVVNRVLSGRIQEIRTAIRGQ